MLKLVLNDYKCQMKHAFSNLHYTDWFIYIYLLIFPTIHGIYAFFYYSSMFSMIFGLLLSRMYPNQLSKTMHLCPLTKEEKRQYIETGFRLRIAVPMSFYLILNGVFVMLGWLFPVYYMGMAFILFIYLNSVNIYCLPEKKSPNEVGRIYNLPGSYELWNVLIQVFGILGTLILASAQMDVKNPVTAFEKCVIGSCILLEFLVFLKIRFTYYKPVMERAVNYENCN